MTGSQQQNILVTGASGLVGQAVVRDLLAHGLRVRALVHETPAPAGAEPCPGDLVDADALVVALRGQHVVVHCAALFAGPEPELERVNVHGTQLLAQLARQAEVLHFVHISSGVVYRSGPMHDAKEFAPLKAKNPYARSKLRAEEAVTDAFGDHVTTLRLPTVYASGPCPFIENLVHVLQHCPLPDTSVKKTSYELVHADDVAQAVRCAVLAPPAHRTYNIAGPDRVDFRELVQLASSALGIQPQWTPAIAPGESPRPGYAGPDDFPHSVYEAATTPRTFCIDAARKQLGYAPVVPWREGVARALEAVPAAGRR